MPTPLKDIAIYRLQRVDKALERLGAAVARLESATQAENAAFAANGGQNDGDLAAAQSELAALKADYEVLHKAASTVADRLDQTIDRLSADSAAPAS